MSERISNIIIDSSAGCGKTYCLEMRIIGMFLNGVEPNETIGMTFTNAAAAEIYRRLLELLCEAAQCEVKHRELINGLHRNGWSKVNPSKEDLIGLLKKLIKSMNDIPISTFDSFFVRVLQLFPIELGLPGNQFSVIDAETATEYKKEELRRLFGAEFATEFVEDCREALFGDEKRQVFDSVTDLLGAVEKAYEHAESTELWRYWMEQAILSDDFKVSCAVKTCRNWMEQDEICASIKNAQRVPLLVGMLRAGGATESTRFSKKEKALFEHLFDNIEDIKNGEKVEGFTKCDFPIEVRAAMLLLLTKVASIMISQTGKRTWGIGNFYRKYLALYRKNVIGKGKVTFADLPRLLSDHERNDYLYDIDYRMNAKLKHWLLDEFQDTSWTQLKVLLSMMDEPDEERSLFVVGDAKQAIYSWRGGDSELMHEVKKIYDLEQKNLDASYRFGDNICAGLNTVFAPENFDEETFAPVGCSAVADSWNNLYRPHESAVARCDQFESVLCCPEQDDDDSMDKEEMYATIISERIKRQGNAWQKMDCAVLVREQKVAARILSAMDRINPTLARQMIWWGDERIAKDPLVAALTGFLIFLQHPANSAASLLVQMHPATRGFLDDNFDWEHANQMLGQKKLDEILLYWLKRIPEAHRQNPNIEILLAAARRFEQQNGLCDMINFRSFVANYKQSDSSLAGKIRMMTIHHSKGLGFDVVFNIVTAPSKNGNWNKPDTKIMLNSPEDGFVLYAPGAAGWLEPKIKAALTKVHRRTVLEEFCVLYVAMTRAKNLMCNIIEPLGKERQKKFLKTTFIPSGTKTAFYLRDWLVNSLFGRQDLTFSMIDNVRCCEFKIGSFCAPATYKVTSAIESMQLLSGDKLERFIRIMPSHSAQVKKLNYELPEAGRGMRLGNSVHDYFAQHEFLNDNSMPTDPVLKKHVAACLASPEVMALLGWRPGVKVWSEQPFELILPDAKQGRPIWRSGRFDRVSFTLDGQGQLLDATIIDFKSNYLAPDADLEAMAQPYLEQMREYGDALRCLTKIAPERICKYLIFTARGKVYRVD